MESAGADKFSEKKRRIQHLKKSHTSNCETKKYKCECGALFSRKDSLISHWAFCDALNQKGSTTNAMLSPVSLQQQLLQPPAPRQSSVSNKLQGLNVADPFAETAMLLREALGAGEELMANLKVSGSENDLTASGIAEKLVLSTKRAQNLLHSYSSSDSLAVRRDDLKGSDSSKLQELNMADPFAQAAISLREALGAGEELMANLKGSGSENDLAEQLLLSTKRAQNLLHSNSSSDTLAVRSDAAKQSLSIAVHPRHFLLNPALPHGMIDDDAPAPISPLLGLSLRPPLKPSFDGMIADDALCYCALFPCNYEFEIDMIVQLWMAHGVFVKEPMERIAGLFFEDCVTKGYFLFCRTNLVTGKAMYKLDRDSCADPILISSGSHTVLIEGNSNLNDVSVEVSHVSVRCYSQKKSTTLQELKRFKQLRTLMFLHGRDSSFKQVPRDFFLSLKLLQVLDLSQTHLVELPSSVGNMKCLRYLNLSETPIKRLPEAIDCLDNLQTLKLRGCSNLLSLPKGMRKLVSLRHLDFDVSRQLRSMPPGLGTLTNIQTLSAFLVGLEEECSIRQLKNMNSLSGNFCISRLENVSTEDEAAEAYLCSKSQLSKLELQWSDTQDEDVLGNGEVVSSLKPNTNLEELHISCYGGFELPSWICDPAFTKLVSITLFKCENCLRLPSLGLLLSLKFLNILDFHKLKVIDHNLYGGLGIQGFVAFPKLEKLAIENMLSLEEWTGMADFPYLLTVTIKHCPKLSSLCTLSYLHSLENLELSHCDMLASWTDGRLPASVETLIIEECPLISAEFLKNAGQDPHKAAHIQNVWVDNQEISFG